MYVHICTIVEKQEFTLYTVWKNDIFSVIGQFIREINSLVTYLVKTTLLPRNFCQSSVGVNFRKFCTVSPLKKIM